MDPDSYPDADPDPAIFLIDLVKIPTKNKFVINFLAYYFLKVLWRTAFSLLIYVYVVLCLTNYGASGAVNPCVVVEKIHEYF
jgi:hypothetical protein